MPARRFTDEEERQIAQQYWARLPDGTWLGSTSIARQWGVRPQTIHNVLKRQGLSSRPSQEAYQNSKRTKPIKNLPAGEAPLCRCGCGGLTAWNQRKNRWNAYVSGHYHPSLPGEEPRAHQPKLEVRLGPHDYREWLYNAYVVRGLSASQIAREAGVGESLIFDRMKRFGIPRRDAAECQIGINSGSKNPAWKGGVTPERQRLYKTQGWRSLVRSVFVRDGFHCQRCGAPKRSQHALHAHHIKPWADDRRLRFDLSNLVTLCRDCHLWVHSLANIEREYLR